MDEFHFMHCFLLILSLWRIPSYDPSKKGVGLKWIDKIQHWSLERYKARLLVQGFTKAFLSHKQLQKNPSEIRGLRLHFQKTWPHPSSILLRAKQ